MAFSPTQNIAEVVNAVETEVVASIDGNETYSEQSEYAQQRVVFTSETEKIEPKKLNSTKDIVKDYFRDIPVLVDVAYCESGIVQFNADGTVLRGFVNPQDVGVMQINEKYHLETSLKMGINIHTLDGNLEYARFLYETQGTRPWEYSSHCWNKHREVALN